MRKNMRLVKMKRVNHIRIAQRVKKKQIIVVRPPRPRRNNRMLRRARTNRPRQLRLDAIPSVRIAHLRLIQNLEENPLRIVT